LSASWLNPALLGFGCPSCGATVAPPDVPPTCPECGRPLVARYDLEALRRRVDRNRLERPGGLWRYRFVLPFAADAPRVDLGEGGTPLIRLGKLGAALGMRELLLKDEAGNPTQSFKARGLSLAVNGARALGKRGIALPSAGNAGSAAAAYAAAAGLACRIAMPEETPEAFRIEQLAMGAEVKSVPGTIADAGQALATWAPAPEWWNVATFKEPFRLEGKKTLGYEIAEQCGWRLPDAILYPTGGGTGLVGMWRAFAELAELGWLESGPPRLIAVQAEGCAPVVRAFAAGSASIEPWANAATVAAGLRVPSPFADRLILSAIRETGGQAVSVSEAALLDGMSRLAREEGCFACPEGGATLAALEALLERGTIRRDERVVIFNTGSGLKYLEAWRAARERVAT
jgi:threonine synthase